MPRWRCSRNCRRAITALSALVLVYGSCLRSGDIDGLLDLYLICDSYRAAYDQQLPTSANWLLPPNIVLRGTEARERHGRRQERAAQQGHRISLRDFQRGCSRRGLNRTFWGRFAQPTRILYARVQLRVQV